MKATRTGASAPHVISDDDRAPGIWWIDDSGSWNHVDPKSANGPMRRPFNGTPEHSQYAFAMLGLVKLQVHPARITIKWNLRRVSPESLAAALDFIQGQPANRMVRLSFYCDGWNVEDHRGPAAAIARIEQTNAYRDVPLANSIHLKSQDLDAVSTAAPLIRRCFETWHDTGGSLDAAHREAWSPLLPYLLMCKLRKADDQLIFAGIGDQADCKRVYSQTWLSSAKNQPYDYHHPGEFSDRTAESYPEVLESGEPRLDHVRSLVPREAREPVWAPYQRLLLPVRLGDGTPALITAGKLTQNINIPFLAG